MQTEFQCSNCRKKFQAEVQAEKVVCPHCQHPLPRTAQISQILETWYYPRRWYRDVPKMTLGLLVEALWTSDGQGEKMYKAVSPPRTNYQVFVHSVTKALIKGLDEGWVKMEIPEDPFIDNPVYRLSYLDSERFADTVAKLFPDVNWDETITIEEAEPSKA